MPEALLVQPDTSFLRAVLTSGGADLKKCYQCGACSVVCTLSPEDSPFPRKQMIEAQWGLKERLVRDPAVWLCHNCGECTSQCPRGARPGDVLGAVRREAIKHFAWPGFMGRLVASPKALALLFLLPVLIFAAIALWAPKGAATPEMEFANVFPIEVLEPLFFVVAGLVAVAFAVGLARFARGLGGGAMLPGLVGVLGVILTHQRFADCGRQKSRYLGHLLTLWAFAGLALMGTVVGLGTMAGWMHTPLALSNPWKIFANLCAVTILIGCALLVGDRIKDPVKRAASTYFDWSFLLVLAGVVATGILSELLRLAQAPVMYAVYFVHLVLVFALFLYAPYSKFAHLAYRTVAMAATRRSAKGAGG
jgi:quinone-modifying oxidoreductase subunit QmoC